MRPEEVTQTSTGAAYSFSTATFEVADRTTIVFSPFASPGRRASYIAHELAHLLLKHQLSEIREISGVPFRTCRPEEEEQATNFSGTLLLPRGLRRLDKSSPAVNRARRVRRRMGTAPHGGGQRTRRQKPNSLATERRRCERSPCSLPPLSTMPARRLIRTAGLAGRLSRRLWACRSRTSGDLGRVRVPWRRLGIARSRWPEYGRGC